MIYSDENKLKERLLKDGFKYGRTFVSTNFVILMCDNKSGATIARQCYNSPIAAIRDLKEIVPQTKIPIDDLDIYIECAYDVEGTNIKRYPTIGEASIQLSYELYFTKPDSNGESVAQ